MVGSPAVLPADGVAVLGVLWEGNVDSDQRRAVLQSHTASDHGHTAGSGRESTEATSRYMCRKGSREENMRADGK